MLTLFIVPVVYTLFDDLARRFRKDPWDVGPASGGADRPEDGAFADPIQPLPGSDGEPA